MHTPIADQINAPLFLSHFLGIIILLIVWTLFWKGLALWHSARRGQYFWFIAFLAINSIGILEIIYLFFVAKKRFSDLFSG